MVYCVVTTFYLLDSDENQLINLHYENTPI